jgi:hypothetical protein
MSSSLEKSNPNALAAVYQLLMLWTAPHPASRCKIALAIQTPRMSAYGTKQTFQPM